MTAFWVYLLGMASLMLADVLVTDRFSSQDIAMWSDVRALFGILAAFVTLGLEMVIVRAPIASRLLLQFVCIQAVVIGVPIGYLAHSLGYFSNTWTAVALAIGAAFSLVQGQYFRAHNLFLLSQIAQQAWRIVVLMALCALLFLTEGVTIPLDGIVAGTIFIVSLMGWWAVVLWPPQSDAGSLGIVQHYKISFRFLVTNVVLSLALFGEQMIVNGLGTAEQAAIYFTHITYFLLPASVVTAFVGFRLGPWLRDNPDHFSTFLTRNKIWIHLGVYGGAAIFHGIGWVGWQIMSPVVGTPDWFLFVMFYVSSVARTFYVLPSAYNGIFGQLRQHDMLIATQVALLAVIGVSVTGLGSYFDIMYLVAAAGAFNWVSRTAIADHVMKWTMQIRLNNLARGAGP